MNNKHGLIGLGAASFFILFFCLYNISLVGCAKVAQPDVIDTTAPIVVTITPTNGAASIAINSTVTATFSKAMDPLTMVAANFTLTSTFGAVTGAVSYDAPSKTIKLTPASNLNYSTTYTASISAAVKDIPGNHLASAYYWSFVTGNHPDTTPPTVVSVSPSADANGVPLNAGISAVFSEAMDTSTINATNFTVNGALAGSVSYDAANLSAVFTPSANFPLSTKYTANISTGVKDTAGNAMASACQWSFFSRDPSSWPFSFGSGPTRIDLDTSLATDYPAQLILFGGTFYAVMNYYNGSNDQISVEAYNGSSWSAVDAGGLNYDITKNGDGPRSAVFNGKLYVIWDEDNGSGINQIRVKAYNGSSWSWADGGTANGINYDNSKFAQFAQLTVFNGKLYAIWEENNGTGQYEIRVKAYDGSSWAWADGGTANGINYNSASGGGTPAFAVFNGKLYACWSEASMTRVKAYDGSSWSWVDGGTANGLNYNNAMGANNPQLAVYNNKLYCIWSESNSTNYQIRLKAYDGSSWASADGGGTVGINYDNLKDAYRPYLAAFNDKLYAIWEEVNGSAEQARVKSYNGSSWSFVDGGGTNGINQNPAKDVHYCQLYTFNNNIYAIWCEQNPPYQYQLKIAVGQ